MGTQRMVERDTIGHALFIAISIVLLVMSGGSLSHLRSPNPNRAFGDEPPKASTSDDGDQNSDGLIGKPLSKKPLRVQMAEEHGYRLAEGEDLKRIPPPFDPIRAKYYRELNSGRAAAINNPPDAMVFHWSDCDRHLVNFCMTFGPNSLGNLLNNLPRVEYQMIDAPAEVLQRQITGDWVVRAGVRDFQIIKQLDRIVRQELQLPFRLELRQVERPAYILTGSYRANPIDIEGQVEGMHNINIFSKTRLRAIRADGGTGDFSDMLEALGNWIATPVVAECQKPPEGTFRWHLLTQSPSTTETLAEDHDPKLVMAKFAAQTGLAFTEEKRPVRILFVTPNETDE